MAYTPYYTTWHDQTTATDTPITAAALNNMEAGIGNAALVAPTLITISPTAMVGIPGAIPISQASVATVASTIYYEPVVVASKITLSALYCRVATASTTAGALARLAVYAANSVWAPGALLLDAGTVATDSTGLKTLSGLSLSLPAGQYLFRLHSDASASQPGITAFQGWPVSGAWLDPSSSLSFVNSATRSATFAAAESTGLAPNNYGGGTSVLFRYYVAAAWAVT